MKRVFTTIAACLLAASAASAQNLQTIKLLPPSGQLEAAQVDQAAMARRSLEVENKKLRDDNARLETENQALSARIDAFTTPGGSEVHAYCPSPTISRNTAGAETNCDLSGGFACEPASGLCHTSCETSEMCAGGFVCDTGTKRCVNASVPETESD